VAKFLRHEKDVKQELILECDTDEAISSNSNNGHDEDPPTADCEVHVW